MQMDELGDDIAIDELKNEVGKSNTIDITVAGSLLIFAYFYPRAYLLKACSSSKVAGVSA